MILRTTPYLTTQLAALVDGLDRPYLTFATSRQNADTIRRGATWAARASTVLATLRMYASRDEDKKIDPEDDTDWEQEHACTIVLREDGSDLAPAERVAVARGCENCIPAIHAAKLAVDAISLDDEHAQTVAWAALHRVRAAYGLRDSRGTRAAAIELGLVDEIAEALA